MAFLFTIEQIELIRRLRKTGMSKEQVWRAYEEMDRLDSELNPVSNDVSINNCVPNAVKNMIDSQINVNPINTNTNTCNLNHININSDSDCVNKNPNVCLPLNKSNSQSYHSENSFLMNNIEKSNPLPSLSQTFNISNISSLNTSHIDLSDEESRKDSSVTITPITVPQSEPSNAITIVQKPEVSIYYPNEEPLELIEFKKKGETVMLNEIRNFVNKYNIRQIMIAEMTKISQGYVSRFFRGEGQDMSDKSKNLIYLWYITCRNRPEVLTQFCPQTIGERRTQLSDAGDLLPIRRDRFIFRKEHLIVLDQYFKDNPYPDASTKEMIADECNKAIESISRKCLKERDKVTISVVSNWFNNKRKEVKSKKSPHNQTFSQNDNEFVANHPSLRYITETSIYSNHSNASVEEVETRPDLSILSDFDNNDSIEMTDDDSQQSFIQQNSHSNSELNNSYIKIEPTF